MFHKDPFIVAPRTFELIQKLQAIPELEGFYLVGGTSLALQIGHRNSIDIDLFSMLPFNTSELIEAIAPHFVFEIKNIAKNTIIGVIDKVKVDFITHSYSLVKPPIIEEGIIYVSKEDIAAMKLNAIINSGKRLKDFIDIFFLLEHFSVNEMLAFFTTKYPTYNPLIALKALSYFEDIDQSIDPPKLKKALRVSTIKKRIEFALLHSNQRI